MAVDATRRSPCLPRRMSPRASVNDQALRRRPRPAQPCGPGTAYGRRSGPCEALHAPLPSTDALGGLFTRRVASQRRGSTAKALAEPLLDRCKPLLGAGGAVLGRCRPLQALFQPFLGSIPPQTPRFRLLRLNPVVFTDLYILLPRFTPRLHSSTCKTHSNMCITTERLHNIHMYICTMSFSKTHQLDQRLHDFAETYRDLSRFIEIYQDLSRFIEIYRDFFRNTERTSFSDFSA